jgi:hypothetical protein
MTSGYRRSLTAAATAALIVLAASAGLAQRIWFGGYGYTPPRFPTKQTFQGSFNFCRAMFESNRREKRGWSTDYPGADLNFSTRLAELTTGYPPSGCGRRRSCRRGRRAAHRRRAPSSARSFSRKTGCLIQRRVKPGGSREYLLKGGFVFASDYWGDWAKEQFDQQIGLALPPGQFPIVDLPLDHSIWHTLFDVKRVPQMPSIQAWRRTGGNTDRGVVDPPSARAIADEHGRIMVVMMHNTDIPDGWEREGEDPEYFYRFSPDAYAVGINVVLYAMAH